MEEWLGAKEVPERSRYANKVDVFVLVKTLLNASFDLSLFLNHAQCVCVRVCVCVRERERASERESAVLSGQCSGDIMLLVSKILTSFFGERSVSTGKQL